jgi:hypothetical protein
VTPINEKQKNTKKILASELEYTFQKDVSDYE